MSDIQNIIASREGREPPPESRQRWLQHMDDLRAMDVIADELHKIAGHLQVLAAQGGER